MDNIGPRMCGCAKGRMKLSVICWYTKPKIEIK